jgi:hypothetical protein
MPTFDTMVQLALAASDSRRLDLLCEGATAKYSIATGRRSSILTPSAALQQIRYSMYLKRDVNLNSLFARTCTSAVVNWTNVFISVAHTYQYFS